MEFYIIRKRTPTGKVAEHTSTFGVFIVKGVAMKKQIIFNGKKEKEELYAEIDKEVEKYWNDIKTCPSCGEIGEIIGTPELKGFIFEKFEYSVECKKCDCWFNTKVKANESAKLREINRII